QNAAILKEQGDERRPPRLVACAEATAVIPVEKLVERNAVAPVRILLKIIVVAQYGTLPTLLFVAEEDMPQAARQLLANLCESQPMPGTGRAFDFECVSIETGKGVDGLNQQEVDGKPDRTAPVGVTAEQPIIREAGQVFYLVFLVVYFQTVGGVEMGVRK